MELQSNDVGNRWIEGPLHREENNFTELFTENIMNKECLKQ